MDIKIEGAPLKLLNEIYEVEKQCFNKGAFPKPLIAALIGDYNSVSLIARVDGEIAGFIICRMDIERKMTVGHILTIDIAPPHQRKGIAQKLLTEIEAILKQKGAQKCRLEVREDNAAALSLYQKLGYKKIAILDHYYGETHGLYLRKTLT